MPPISVQQAFEIAFHHHQSGRLAEAAAIYQQILSVQPNHAHAQHLFGVIENSLGRHEQALACIQRAIALDPHNAAAFSNLGEVFRCLGRFDEAIEAYRRAIAVDPNLPEAYSNLGNVLQHQDKHQEAAAMCRRALALRPNYPEAWNNLGNALADLNRLDEAVAAFQRALELNPGYVEPQTNLGNTLQGLEQFDEAIAIYLRVLERTPDSAAAHNNLGAALLKKDEFEKAVACFRRALELRPRYADAFHNLGMARKRQGQLDDAIAAYREALALRPHEAEMHNDLGVALSEMGQWYEAVASFRRAIELMSDGVKAWSNLGYALTDLGDFEEAKAAFRRALELDPNFGYAQFGQALLHLLHGDFAQGWPSYEVRWEAYRSAKRDFSQPLWDGSRIDGRRLLIHAEQGYGDAIQFIRYAEMAAARGAQVIVECPPPLVELLRGVRGVDRVVAKDDPLPPFDFHVPMLSQPRLFQTTHETIPADTPYLFADPIRREEWAQRLGAERRHLRVGLVWAGNARHRRARIRDIPFDRLRPLWSVENVEFFSLQVAPDGEEIRQTPPDLALIDYTKDLRDFSDTAALITELDLVISVDTAVAHLAGALGRPTWTLLPFVPDWRWGLEGDRSPWYPTMRLFRQPAVGDWDSVIPLVAEALKQEALRFSKRPSQSPHGRSQHSTGL